VAAVIDLGKKNLLGVQVDAVDYEAAVERVMAAARDHRPCAVTALAVHGVMTGVDDDEHRYRLNHMDLVTADGQPVRWAMNLLHGTGLRERVYGPELTLQVCAAAAREGLPVFFYGSRPEVLDRLVRHLTATFPDLKVAGTEPSKFRSIDASEKTAVAHRIQASGAAITFVGLGCPRQEIFAYEFRDLLDMPLLAVGAAFDYHAGLVREPPGWIQRRGLQWAYRLIQDPRRLWRRYLVLNPRYMMGIAAQRAGISRRRDAGCPPRVPVNVA
jgi:N-acetylglucosaminyldiphosphoundecaprenol N-acetyl-beta-D-mannosaminyltransferase